jgi:hypothetical protein
MDASAYATFLRFRSMTNSIQSNVFTLLALLALGCSGNGSDNSVSKSSPSASVGAPCVPYDETIADYTYGKLYGIDLAFDSLRCGEDFCVQHDFQGRVSCPYGQTAEDIQSLPANDPARCRVTDASGNVTDQPVMVPVLPQFVDRRAEKFVYCGCACSGTDNTAQYCTCPEGMQCQSVIPFRAINGVCVRTDSLNASKTPATVTCSRTSTDPATDCGNGRRNP